MYDIKEILQLCLTDRRRSLEAIEVGWYKKNAVDLVLKFYILLFNSLGRRKYKNSTKYVFVDEVKNKSMIDNLRNTYEVFKQKNASVGRICMYKPNRKGHMRAGIVFTIILTLSFTFSLGVRLIKACLTGRDICEDVMHNLILYYCRYLDKIDRNTCDYLMMTDHHFYSSIIALRETVSCSVLQHGLILDKRFYYPIRASRFYAWGSRSKELLEGDERVVIAGTYKFKDIIKNPGSEQKRQVMYCISILDNEKVRKKIDELYRLSRKQKFKLLVKCHPGSMFDVEKLRAIYQDSDIIFYQEETLDQISFDVAITENSTIIIDLAAMGKPFILYDDIDGYFSLYSQEMLWGEDIQEIAQCLHSVENYDFNKINQKICSQELNHDKCIIFEKECGL